MYAGIAPIMTSLAATLHSSALPARIVASWNAAAARWHPVGVIVVAWAVLAVPLVFFRGYTAHEGLAVSIARTALETGDWLTPHMYNVRFVERPTLQSWIIAAISAPFGDVNQITARLPSVLFLLFGCLLIYWLLRKVAASVPAALLGVALFLACPLVMRSYVMITADLPLAVLLFFAFVLWWSGYAKDSVSVTRWLVIGVVLALAALLKGPQPVAYFALGVGLFIVGTRSWRQIPGLVLSGVICAVPLAGWYMLTYAPGDEATWGAFMRLAQPRETFSGPIGASLRVIADTLPAALLAGAFLIAYGFREKRFVRPQFMAALASYAFVAAILILFWPGGSTPRYYLPMVLPLCVFGGLGYDQLSVRRPQLVAPILVLTAGLLLYALAYSVASPLLPQHFRQAQVEGARVTALIHDAPGPIYWSGDVALNLLPYLPLPIQNASFEELGAIPAPAWIIMTTADAEASLPRRPGKLRIVTPLGDAEQWRLLRLDP